MGRAWRGPPMPRGCGPRQARPTLRTAAWRGEQMDWWQAVVIGVVEGLTEYLPVSSTAHILLTQRALGLPQDEAADAYAVCVQAGAILAVLGIYARRVAQMLRGLAGRDPEGQRLAVNIIVAFLPAMAFGLLFNRRIKEYLFHLWPICGAWFIG